MKPLTEWWAALDRSHRSALGVAALAVVLLVVVVITSSGIITPSIVKSNCWRYETISAANEAPPR